MSTLTLTEFTPATEAAARTPLVSGRLALVLMSTLGAMTSFYLLLSVTPMYAAAAGAGDAGAGLVTGVLMLASVLAEFAAPGLMRRCGNRAVLALSAVLLGAPALALLGPQRMATIVVVSLVRGLGFGLSVVVTGALVALLLPPGRRGEGFGVFGLVACVPAVAALPSGVWLAGNSSNGVVIAITAATALLPLAAVRWIPAGAAEPEPAAAGGGERPPGLLGSLRHGGQLRPSLIFAATTVSGGVVVAFLPLAVGAGGSVAAVGLFAQAATATLSRWLAGRLGDRHGHASLLVPGLVIAAIGMATLIWVATPAAVIVGMCLFGTGFGAGQTATFALMIDRAPASGYGAASALWNLAYDAGYGAGPALFGLFAARTGYPAAFVLTALLMVAALRPAWRERSADVGSR
jgi:MFS family permease